jgi:hypothetical protein
MYTIPKEWNHDSAVVANADTTSTVIRNIGSQAVGVILPVITGTTLGISVCNTEDGTFTLLKTTSGTISMTVSSSAAYKLPDDLKPFPYFKLILASQGAERTITVVRKS